MLKTVDDFIMQVICEVRVVAYTREEAARRLMESCEAYYNVIPTESEESPLLCVCEFFQKSEGYVMFRKANIWTIEAEEFIYLYSVSKLTEELFQELKQRAYDDGMKRANIGAGHMCTYVTAVFLCDTCTEGAKKALQKCSVHKTFLFSLHGWLDLRLAVYETADGSITTNRAGKATEDFMRKVI